MQTSLLELMGAVATGLAVVAVMLVVLWWIFFKEK